MLTRLFGLSIAAAGVLLQGANPFWEPVRFHVSGIEATRFEGQAGAYRFSLSNPDDPTHPAVWDSALSIERALNDTVCKTEPLLVQAVYAAPRMDRALVISRNGSLTYVDLIKLSTCHAVQPQWTVYTKGVTVSRDRITVQAGCECPGEGPCFCSAAQILVLERAGTLRLLAAESMALTQKTVGVTFEGQRQIAGPFTPQARLIEIR